MNRLKENSPQTLAIIALLLGGICIGTSPIFVRLSETGPVASAFWRVFLVLPLFYFAMVRGKSRHQHAGWKLSSESKRRIHKIILWSGFFFAADLAFWHWSLQYTTVANANLLSNLMPVVVALGAFFIFKETLSRLFFVGLALSICGAGFLAGGSFSANPERLFGDGLGVITALFYGAYILTIGLLRRDVDTATIMFWTGVVAAILLVPLTLLMGDVIIPESLYGWAVLFGLAFVGQFMGQGLITFGLANLPSAFGAITLLIQPIVSASIAWPLFGEALGFYEFLGGLIILSGIVLARLGTPSLSKKKPIE